MNWVTCLKPALVRLYYDALEQLPQEYFRLFECVEDWHPQLHEFLEEAK